MSDKRQRRRQKGTLPEKLSLTLMMTLAMGVDNIDKRRQKGGQTVRQGDKTSPDQARQQPKGKRWGEMRQNL